MSQAAKLLGISRSTLYSRLEAAGRAGAKLAASDPLRPDCREPALATDSPPATCP